MSLGLECRCDAARLQSASSVKLEPDCVNPFSLREACSPNIAAKLEGAELSAEQIAEQHLKTAQAQPTVSLLYEGAGGWFTPINANQTLADVALPLKLPVVLVVGVKLGCLNHALLSEQAIAASDNRLLGWVASEPAPAQWFDEQVQTLNAHLSSPCLGVVRHGSKGDLDWPLG